MYRQKCHLSEERAGSTQATSPTVSLFSPEREHTFSSSSGVTSEGGDFPGKHGPCASIAEVSKP